eukprot:TRINITY_DN12715_c0_g2_i1.p1 TRINITY_DN12715_c0_g2~~TRINITY_DN12715_c0_g2_i1.p1  ORF type:complete len:573 (+),score=121.59 TRINITY_DN12715_c0_g2_i1:83-1720(+)
MARGFSTLAIAALAATSSFGVNADDSLIEGMKELQALLEGQELLIKKQQGELRGLKEDDTRDALAMAAAASAPARKLSGAQPDVEGACNHIWLILCGALVMFMQAGFAMVEAGCCRAKNVQNILLKNLTDVAVGTLGWWMCGWAFAYSGPYKDDGFRSNGFMGFEQWFGHHFLTVDEDGNQKPTDTMLSWFFQWAFCSAAATIVSGGVAERVNFPGYCIFTLLMTIWVYPIVVSWTWGYGWLAEVNDVGYMDFAGSGIVHMAGGVGALVGAIIAGPRTGRFDFPDDFAPHSLPLVVLGTFILWFGWYGFNCGSTLGMSSHATGQLAAHVAMNTTIGGATGGLTVFILRLIVSRGLYDIGGFCNGILAGLVSVTAPCGNVECGSAFGIALVGGCLYQGASMLLQKLKVDDPIDAFAVHGAAGAWGTLAAAFFDWGKGFDHYHGWSGFDCMKPDGSDKCGTGYGGQGVIANIAEVFAIAAWVAFWSTIIFLPLRVSGKLRATDALQEAGMDTVKHSPSKAYSIGEDRHSPSKAYGIGGDQAGVAVNV